MFRVGAALVVGTILLASAPAQAFPTMHNGGEIERLRKVLVSQAITCPRVVTAWYLTDPADRDAKAKMWKVSCSTGTEWEVSLDVPNGTYYMQDWRSFYREMGPPS